MRLPLNDSLFHLPAVLAKAVPEALSTSSFALGSRRSLSASMLSYCVRLMVVSSPSNATTNSGESFGAACSSSRISAMADVPWGHRLGSRSVDPLWLGLGPGQYCAQQRTAYRYGHVAASCQGEGQNAIAVSLAEFLCWIPKMAPSEIPGPEEVAAGGRLLYQVHNEHGRHA